MALMATEIPPLSSISVDLFLAVKQLQLNIVRCVSKHLETVHQRPLTGQCSLFENRNPSGARMVQLKNAHLNLSIFDSFTAASKMTTVSR